MNRPEFDETPVKLRGFAPRWIVNVLDAVAMARGPKKSSRIEVLVDIAGEWAEARIHEAALVTRCTKGEGSNGETTGRFLGGEDSDGKT